MLIAPHRGQVGPVDQAGTFLTEPLWQRLAERYEPDPQVVEALAAIDRDVELQLSFGTWCGDSRREVPKLLKALELADNPHLNLRMTSLAPGFDEPLPWIRDAELTNVPTLIVREGGQEIGRFVETAAGASMPADLATMLARQPLQHQGPRGDGRLRLSGRYERRDAAGNSTGVEHWELFEDADGGRRLHAWNSSADATSDMWHLYRPDGALRFVEITRRHGDWHSRSRYSVRDGKLQVTTRGDGSGIVRQVVDLDEQAAILSSAMAASGGAWSHFGHDAVGTQRRPALLLEGAGGSPVARPTEMTVHYRGGATVDQRSAHHVILHVDGDQAEWWFDQEWGLPLRGRLADGSTIALADWKVAPEE